MALLGFGLVALLRKKRKGVAKLPGYGALILLLSLLGFVAMNALGCGGGTPDITPSGSGSVTVTASAGALQQSQTLTLTIQ
jgi:hypothetical protein